MNKSELKKFLKENFKSTKNEIKQYELGDKYKTTFSVKENNKVIIELEYPDLDLKKLNKLKSLFKTKNIEIYLSTSGGCGCHYDNYVNATLELNTNIKIDKLKINKKSYTYD